MLRLQAKLIMIIIALLLTTTACAAEASWAGQSQASFAAMNLFNPAAACTTDHLQSSTAGFVVLLTTGLLTGLSHCVGMCGPLVSAFTLRRRANRQELSTPLVLYQLGRLTTYMTLGTILGAAGYFLTAIIRQWQGVMAVGLGVMMALMGLNLLGLLPLPPHLTSTRFAGAVAGQIKRLTGSHHPAAPFGLGLANGLLPCGPIYALGLLAATSGDPLRGAGVMLIFGLGTLPAMLGVGLSVSMVGLKVRRGLYRLAAGLVVLVGMQLALRGLALSGQVAHAAVGGVMLW